jgi:hypothetical protein
MNDKIWKIETSNGEVHSETVTCEICGVAQDGSLLCFNIDNGQPTVIRGYAPGVWCRFHVTTLRMN